jgi:amino acid adenylation domain-containing protein
MLAFNHAPNNSEFHLPGLTLQHWPLQQTTTPFDLHLSLLDHGNRIVGHLLYARDLFERATIERYVTHFDTLLRGMVADDRRLVVHLPLLTEAERYRMLVELNVTAAPASGQQLVHRLFEEQAESQPQALAVEHAQQSLTYEQLNRRANQLAHRLLELGVRPDDRVAVCVERGVGMVVGLLGILKAGGGYVSLDPAYPAERLAFILEDSDPRVLLTQSSLRGQLPVGRTPLLLLDGPGLESARADNPDAHALGLTAGHLAYVIYTSGTTGRPKGVMIEHGNTVNFLSWARNTFARDVLDRTLFSTSLSFDLAVFECFAPLVSGGRVCIVDNVLHVHKHPLHVSLINTVPSALQGLLDLQEPCEQVDTVNVAGEPLPQGLAQRLFTQTGVRRLCNLYGPSETTTYSTWVEMTRATGFLPHIGRPIANTQIYILDASGQPLPIGVTGEIYIGGAGVARGYLNQPELTAERFVDNPFRPGRMYKTGDLGRWRADRNIEYQGRNDAQVKLRGFRIELGEIETRLGACPGVHAAAAVVRELSPGEKRLVAYLVPEQGWTLPAAQLREQLAKSLPEYMIPSAYVLLQELPLTPNGKIDRRALPAPNTDALTLRLYEPPQGDIETTIAAVWQCLLQIERVGRGDHFFELGGHSLMVIRLVAQLRDCLQVEVEPREIFTHPTLLELADRVLDLKLAEFASAERDVLQDLLNTASVEELQALVADYE